MLKRFKEIKIIKEVKFLHVGSPFISEVDYEARATVDNYTFSYLVLYSSKEDKENYLKQGGGR